MRILSIVLILSSIGITGQSSGQNGNAKAVGECSVAHSGSGDIITIQNCGIGKEQADKIVSLLYQVLANKDQGKKLDDILAFLKQSSPYAIIKTYEPNGMARTRNESTGLHTFDRSAELEFREAEKALDDANYQEAISIANRAIGKYPGWFTPYYFLGIAYMRLCKLDDAHKFFVRLSEETENAPAYNDLHANAQQNLNTLNDPKTKTKCLSLGVHRP